LQPKSAQKETAQGFCLAHEDHQPTQYRIKAGAASQRLQARSEITTEMQQSF